MRFLNFLSERKVCVTLDPKHAPIRVYKAEIQNFLFVSRLILSFDTPMAGFTSTEWFLRPVTLEVKDSKGIILDNSTLIRP